MADQSDAITRHWAEYERLRIAREIGAAFARLGEIHNVVQSDALRPKERASWLSKLLSVPVTDEDLRTALQAALERIGRLRKILTYGDQFEYEEILWAITLRVEVDMIFDFIRLRKCLAEADVLDIDGELRRLKISHSAEFQSARAAAKRNWGLAIRHWLL